ncbi:phytanoyl-CoA dioxygenase family protein [Mucilaginibacter sp. HMF5004]|uniref:phytanoyl-CoA dioxygenase family protein n=1 Tax=Mucilaginibacter rivuli TaxID=2857527 RepID=UPI001C5F7ED8|nr:phytanoyl-CoA dioxygenase family protein [Mucilaginibacter rivuli]MBW4888203.1 phytanoyl-CoA dioxygenase family protein [Mucilaginibacter rivuli]
MVFQTSVTDFDLNGFTIINGIYCDAEIENINSIINNAPTNKDTFRKTQDLFAIRQFIKEVPQVAEVVFNDKLKQLIAGLFGKGYFVSKSIYFDKPAQSNWFVAYHQDLTISVDNKIELSGFGPWTVKQNQFAVQPPIKILQDNFTIRIHLDEANEDNGALRVIPGSNLKGVYRAETINWNTETETTCCVKKGGVMLMRPLLLHASGKTVNNKPRRVIHIEFSKAELPDGIAWSEKFEY